MCGIAGIFAYKDYSPVVDKGELLLIRDRMRNRGPDGAGLWISDDLKVGLAHRRLSIIDLSEAGAQPMLDAETGNQIVFNGEIYNYRALRRELEKAGHRFRSHSDTEVLLRLYAQHGAGMVHKLRGMYAFALWDARRKGLFFARDPFGIKPLYLADDGQTLRFASQVKALVAGGGLVTEPEPAGHVGFFLWGHVPEPYTLFKGIRAFPAGTSLWIDRGGDKEEARFFDLTQEFAHPTKLKSSISKAEAQECLRAAMLDSVRHHMVSDVPVGLFLSAGLDSATLLALAGECLPMGTALNTLTLAFREFAGTRDDEAHLAEILARQYGALHRTKWVQRQDFVDQMDQLIDAMDQPSIDGINSYFVCQAARQTGLKVALSGLGGDELFAGYSQFQTIPHAVRWMKPIAKCPLIGRTARILVAPLLRHFQIPAKIAGLMEYGGSTAGAYLLLRCLTAPWELRNLLQEEFFREGWKALTTLHNLGETIDCLATDRVRISALETKWYMRNQLLRDTDWAGMAHGVEVRVPLVDVELFRTVQSLIAANSQVGKHEMASTPMQPIPLTVLNRRKTGFSVPIGNWIQGAGKLNTRLNGSLQGWAIEVHQKYSSQLATNPLRGKYLRGTGSRSISSSQISLLASEVTGRGGIQSFMLRLAEVMQDVILGEAATKAGCISLNDSTDSLRSNSAMPPEMDVWGAQRSKLRLAIYTLFKMPCQNVLLVGHVGLAPLAYWLKKLGKVQHYFVILHGIEAWHRLARPGRKALLAADHIIATTVFTAQECARNNKFSAACIHVIPLCADERNISPSKGFRLNGEFKLLCVARQDASEKYKGFGQIFQALAQVQAAHPGLHLNLVGTGNDQARLKTIASELGVNKQVTFWGALSDEDLTAAYRDCDVYVMPSKKEGFGIVFLEAMRWKKPCIGGNHGGTPDVIAHGKSGYLVDYEDIDGLAHYLTLLEGAPALRCSLGEHGRTLVETVFSKRNFIQSYANLIVSSARRGAV